MPVRGTSTERGAGTRAIMSSGSGGLRVDTGTYKVVYFAFGFEAINSTADRETVMEKVLTWLDVIPEPPSLDTQLLAVMNNDIHSPADLNNAKLCLSGTPYSDMAEVALDTYGIDYFKIMIPASDRFLALKKGIIDAVLVTEHPWDAVVADGFQTEVKFLPWSQQAIEAVTQQFSSVASTRLPSYTYPWQPYSIPGYAPVNNQLAEVSISPESQNVSCGETFTIDIVVSPEVAVAGSQFDLSFDPSLIAADDVEEGDFLNQNGASTYFSSGTIDNEAGNIVGVAGAITTPGQTVSTEGIFATISFTAKEIEEEVTSPLDLLNVIVGDIDGNAVLVSVHDGNVTITPYEDWDVTCDDQVNVLDMIRVGQHWGETGEPHWIREDVNRDGNINVLDMILIGQHWTTLSFAKPMLAEGETVVSVSPPSQSVTHNEEFNVEVAADPKAAIAGMQFSLSFDPLLITVDSIEEGNLLNPGWNILSAIMRVICVTLKD